MVSFAWGGLKNGRIPTYELVDVGGGYLRADAARQFQLMAADFKRFFGTDLTISEGYRDLAEQERLYKLWQSGSGFAASYPGGSIHGWALAVDINSWCYGGTTGTEQHNWLISNGRLFGFDWTLTGKPNGEPWHFDYALTPEITEPPQEDELSAEFEAHARVQLNQVQDLLTAISKQDLAHIKIQLNQMQDLMAAMSRSDLKQIQHALDQIAAGTGITLTATK